MSDSGQDRSEAATPRRREEARRRGQSASSTDLSNGLSLSAMCLLLLAATPLLGQRFLRLAQQSIVGAMRLNDWTMGQHLTLLQATISYFVSTISLVVIGAWIAGVFSNVSQKGFQLSPEALEWKVSRLSPVQGFQRIFSYRALVRAFMALLKFTLCAVAVVTSLYILSGRYLFRSIEELVTKAWYQGLQTALAGSLVLVPVGLGDFLFQRWQFEQDLKMTRQQLKDEAKDNEGDPKVKGRLRKLQAESSKARSIADVPKATVVVTNPTHYAVAIIYERDNMVAPRVIAKGKGELALRIRAKAAEAGVPILERKMLARALYASTNVGTEIPADLYRAVAEVLSFVYKLRPPS